MNFIDTLVSDAPGFIVNPIYGVANFVKDLTKGGKHDEEQTTTAISNANRLYSNNLQNLHQLVTAGRVSPSYEAEFIARHPYGAAIKTQSDQLSIIDYLKYAGIAAVIIGGVIVIKDVKEIIS